MNDNRKAIALNPEAVGEDGRHVHGWVSTVDVDMEGDIVLPGGMDTKTYFETTRSVDLEHDSSKAVGRNRDLSIRDRGVWAVTFVSTTPLGEDVLTMIREGVISSMSIEWDPRTLVASPPTPEEVERYGPAKRVFRRWTLTSYAFTARPCNPRANIVAVKSFDPQREQQIIWTRMDELVRHNKISRESAVKAGFPDTATRTLFPTYGPADCKRTIIVDGNDTIVV